ncbi:MAG: O-antigen polysaccharide polymerase Wzy [Bacteroidota bacterium]
MFIFIWNVIFIAAYSTFKRRFTLIDSFEWKTPTNVKGNFPLYIVVILIVSLLIIAIQYDFIVQRILYKNFLAQDMSMQKMLIVVKTFFSIPFIGLIMTIIYLKESKKLNLNRLIISVIFLFILAAFFFVKNPMIEKRNALGPIFITLILFIKPKLLNTNKKFVSFMFLSMVIVFPLISILTHSKVGLKDLISKPNQITNNLKAENIFNEFNTLHYDAYSNTLATMDYVDNYGITYGNQFLGGIFFFIPRSIWTSKPESTGKFIGQYLIKNYNMWFDNISNPFLSEGIINFGFLSLFIFPILLAWFIVLMLNWQYSNDLFKQVTAIYFSIHLIFLLRGDFTNGWAYFVGTFIGIYIIPKVIIQIINSLPKKKIE